jgi:ribosomal protein S18 acetylase RimI-like enzyme
LSLRIRRYRPGDEPGAYEVCLRTGDSGQDATGQYDDPALLGHVYVGAYLALAPAFAFVLVDADDEVVGYTLGAPDTEAFARECEASWWPPLRQRYAHRPDRASDAELVDLIHHPHPTDAALAADYPAHLHIDLLPRGQGAGWGRALIERLMAEFESAGVTGVHLGVAADNTRAIGFYQRLGFTTVATLPDTLMMARPVRP